MALEGEYETVHGIKLDKAFFKVIEIRLEWVAGRNKWYTRYTMAVYADRAARRLDKHPIQHLEYRMKSDLTGGKDKENIIAICYNNFKQQNKDKEYTDV